MGSHLCGQDTHEKDINIFEYRYAEDDKEIKIQHNDNLLSSLDEIRPSLDDCEKRLRHSGKRFKDVMLPSEPIKLACDGKEIRCHFERPEAFLKRDSNLRNKIYRIVDRANCRSSNIIVGDEVMQYFGVFQCYLADNPDLIDRIILTNPNSYGIHAIYVVHEGKREALFIDDYILCNEHGPLFSKPIKYTDMWPCLLEKAWFKLKSSLKTTIASLNPIEVFKSFLTYPTKAFPLGESPEENRKLIKQAIIEPAVKNIKVGCVVTSKMKPHHKIGLSGRRPFYLVKTIFYQGKVYFYLRNPCGQFDFRGILSDIPQDIEYHISKTLGDTLAHGDFLLTEQQFQEQIESFFIVSYNHLSPIVSDKPLSFFSSETNEVYIRFQLSRSCPVSLRLQQLNKLGFDPVTYLLVDYDRKAIVSGERNDEGCFGVEDTNLLSSDYQTLMPGNYILRIKKKPQKKENYAWLAEATLKSRDILIATAQEDIKFDVSNQFKEEFQSVLKAYAKKELSLHRDPTRDEIQHIVLWLGDIVIVYINKLNSGKETISTETYFPELKNLECISDKIGTGYSSLKPFKQDTLIIFEKIILTEETSLGSYSLSPY